MSTKTQKQQEWALDSIALQDAFTDFVLSRQAMLCSPATVKWYSWTLGKFLDHLTTNGVAGPHEIAPRHVREYLSGYAGKGLSGSYIHGHARAIKTFLRFCEAEGYISQPVKFAMPSVGKKRLPVLDASQVKRVLGACKTPRDFALIVFMVDTGVRRAELCALNWGDVNLENGSVLIARGKGNKARSVVAGIKTRRALLKYKRTVNSEDGAPLFQPRGGGRLSYPGLRSALLRVGERAGVQVSPHALRRTFALLSIRAGMGVMQLQALMGHASLEQTRAYVQMVGDDLLTAHQQHGPIDRWV